MNSAFMVIAAGLVAVATTLLVFPTLRAGRDAGQLRGSLGWIAAIAVLLPIGALGLYRTIGTPAALDPSAYRQPVGPSVDDVLARLRADALLQPGNLASWLRLGRAAATMQKPDVAWEAFDRALKIAPDNPDIMVAYAETVAAKRPDHRLDDATRAVLEHAIGINPRHQHGLLLLGVADYQDGRFGDAANRWKQLLALLPPGSSIAEAISGQIANAEARILDGSPRRSAHPMLRHTEARSSTERPTLRHQ